MLIGELPDLEETASGKELIAIGEKRGEERGLTGAILVLLKDRFRSVSAKTEKRIENLPRAGKEQLLTLAARAKTLKEVEDWLRQQ